MSISNISSSPQENPEYRTPAPIAGAKDTSDLFPDELLQTIFSFLDEANLSELKHHINNKRWRTQIIGTIITEQSKRIKNFKNFIFEKLHMTEENGELIKKHKELFEKVAPSSNSTLDDLKSTLSKMKRELLESLKQMNEMSILEVHKFCRENKMPKGFENFAKLLELHNELNKTYLQPDNPIKFMRMNKISKELASEGEIEKSLEIAKNLDQFFKQICFKNIVLAQIRRNEIKQAFEIRAMIPELIEQITLLDQMSSELVKKNGLEKTIVLLKKSLDEADQSACISTIVKLLLEGGDFKKSFEVSQVIPEKSSKLRVLKTILEAMHTHNQSPKEIALVKKEIEKLHDKQ